MEANEDAWGWSWAWVRGGKGVWSEKGFREFKLLGTVLRGDDSSSVALNDIGEKEAEEPSDSHGSL